MTYRIHTGDCRRHMQEEIPASSVHCVVSSPPYWGGIRDYQIPELTWADDWVGDYGSEPMIEGYLSHTMEIFDGLRRVLRDDGVVFWNVGDTYATGAGKANIPGGGSQGENWHGGSQQPSRMPQSVSAGNKCFIPHRVAIALQDAGWIVRQDIVWRKPSPMPESVNGMRWERHRNCGGCKKCESNGGYVLRRGSWRPTNGHEYIFMITKTNDYFCDADAVKEVAVGGTPGNKTHKYENQKCANGNELRIAKGLMEIGSRESRNPRSVWTIPTEPYKGGHFAAFPSALPYKCLQAAVSQFGCCDHCGSCYAPIIEKERNPTRPGNDSKVNEIPLHDDSPYHQHSGAIAGNRDPQRHTTITNAIGYRPTCDCNDSEPVPCTVYDPFSGSGTTVQVAHWMGLNAIGSELGEQYLLLIQERIETRPKCFPSVAKQQYLPGQMTLFSQGAN